MSLRNWQDIFKVNDIRGIYPTQLDEEAAFKIGKGLVKMVQAKQVAIGRDGRLSSLPLFKALSEGIMDNGSEVIDLGLVSTDAFYFAMGKYNYPAGIMITASHNPPQFNGFKICRQGPVMLYEDNGLEQLKEVLIKNDIDNQSSLKGKIEKKDIIEEFIEHLISFINLQSLKNYRFGIDASGGMAVSYLKLLISKLKGEFYFINDQIDGTFSCHSPNSFDPKSYSDLKKLIKDKKLDLGILFDGDADRVTFLDETGEYVDASIILILLIKHLMKNNTNEPVVYDSVLSPSVLKTINQFQGIPIRARIGHSFMKQAMREHNALVGAEHTGHYYFRDLFFSDSGALTFLFVLEILSEINKPLSVIKKEIDQRVRITEKNYQKGDNYEKQLDSIKDYYQNLGYQIDVFDGLILENKDTKIHIHPANTAPFIRINLEADDRDILLKREKELNNLLNSLNFVSIE
ncbi:MAG: phosphomannomutase/phosphoglucomutase [Parcubacteria group bacterium]|nr:phosphomannomutase/phosphoglucomutase [Parcubacteria group bacterium]